MEIVVHGGAGAGVREPAVRRDVLGEAAVAGSEQDAPDAAVVAAVSILERSPRFNAGVGGAVQSDGTIRTDASIMTDDRAVGAACSMEGVANAIAVADAVRTRTPHVLLAGRPAVGFAESVGVETGVDLWADRNRRRWAELELDGASTRAQLAAVREHFGAGADTVGAVAVDGERVAAGTSTGGRWLALAGRVGDVPLVGAGFFANEFGGASATGAGEDIARLGLSRAAVESLEAGASPATAAASAVRTFERHVDGNVGIVVMSPDGDLGRAHASPAMQTCHARDGRIEPDA